MKLLLCSDLHCSVQAAQSIVQRSADVDVVIGAGDFANLRSKLHLVIDVFKQIECPTILVPGNNESHDELTAACDGWRAAHVLHGSGVRIGGMDFYGLGGGVPVTPFGSWSYDFDEAEAAALLADCPESAVLVSHSPPHGVADATSAGKHVGSVSVRSACEEKSLALVVCGHIHASSGRHERIGVTDVVNAGPHGVIWQLTSGSGD